MRGGSGLGRERRKEWGKKNGERNNVDVPGESVIRAGRKGKERGEFHEGRFFLGAGGGKKEYGGGEVKIEKKVTKEE
jgi:hypothetical protein